MATNGVGMYDSEIPAAALGGKVSDAEDGRPSVKPVALVSKETSHRVGEGNIEDLAF